MTKILEWLETNAIRIIVTTIVIGLVLCGAMYVNAIRNDISNLTKQISLNAQVEESRFDLSLKVYELILTDLESIITYNQFIIDQNRANAQDKKEQHVTQKSTKPSYEEIRSHSVWIEGCSGDKNRDDKVNFPIGEDGMCWGGTGVVLKITDTETYFLTNNHVTGKGEKDVKLYIKNDKTRKLIKAEIVAQHPNVDVAVIKIKGVLPNKVAIPGISTAHIQDPVYVVGNPLGVRDVYSEGVVAGYEDISMLIQMPCIYGNSGSGVFDQNGKLVGLVYALEGYSGFLGIPEVRITHSLVVDSISIQVFLKDLGLYE